MIRGKPLLEFLLAVPAMALSSVGSALRDLATRRCLLAKAGGSVKSVSQYMKACWGSFEGFVSAHAAEGLVLDARGVLCYQPPAVADTAFPQLAVAAEPIKPRQPLQREAMDAIPVCLSQLLM